MVDFAGDFTGDFALAYSQALLNSWFWNKLATIWDNIHGLFPFSIFLA